ncbi:hypothetical protein Bbelb_138550 [Branchiostoma belcheri]|nr:hypothetical protein Bbelb_138550 [Branchiostoma belcheri]
MGVTSDEGAVHGADMDSLKRSHTAELVQAIARQDKSREVAALRRLGDISLQEGCANKAVANLKNAPALYRAALRRCKDVVTREALERQVKYADKQVATLPPDKGQEHSKTQSHTQEMTISQVSEILGSLDNALENAADLDPVKIGYEDALVSAIVSNNTLLEVEALKGIADVNLEVGQNSCDRNVNMLEDAIKLYKAALEHCDDSDGQVSLVHRIRFAEKTKTSATKSMNSHCMQERGSQKSEPKLVTAAEELLELDLSLESGFRLEVAERGYESKLIQALSSGNGVLEFEALKSLGDLYLQKAKVSKDKEEHFNKACALYSEVLQQSVDKNEQLVMEHRIKYAEKCMKLVYCPEVEKLETKTSVSTILDVMMALQEVREKYKLRGEGVQPLIEGYTHTYLRAILERNQWFKTEALKSLGDLYAERGRINEDETDFVKAKGLYKAALKMSTHSAQSILKDRIQNIERVMQEGRKKQQQRPAEENVSLATGEEVHQQSSSHNNGESSSVALSASSSMKAHNIKDADRLCKEHLQEGDEALKRGDLDVAEHHFAAALKAVHVRDSSAVQYQKEAQPLCRLANVYLQRGKATKEAGNFTKAAALCNAASVRAATDLEHDQFTVETITTSFCKHVLEINITADPCEEKEHKKQLKEMRADAEKGIKAVDQQEDPCLLEEGGPKRTDKEENRVGLIRTLFDRITESRRVFVAELVDECMKEMGPPPCKYSLIGLGSQAIGLVTPYSDLEFSILIEDDSESNVIYFRNLTHYLHLKVISLGETILPAMGIKSLNDFYSGDPADNWFYDSVTPRGFAFDGAMPKASKTPLGRGKTLTTPASELIHTPQNMIKLLEKDANQYLKEGYHLALILGNVSLIHGDQELVDEYNALLRASLDGRVSSSQLAQVIVSDNLAHFEKQEVTARLLDVKKEIYRLPTLSATYLALFHGITPTTIWSTITSLERVIGHDNAHHLSVLVSISAEVRLRTYLSNGGQKENMSVLSSMQVGGASSEELRKVFYYSNKKQLLRYYHSAMPLKRLILNLSKDHTENVPSCLYDTSPQVQAAIYQTLCSYQEAIGYYEEALQMRQSIYGKSAAHPAIATTLSNLASAWHDLGDDRKVVRYHEHTLAMLHIIYGQNATHPDIATTLNNLGSTWSSLGNKRKAISYHKQALNMLREIHGESASHPHIAVSLNNLGSAWHGLGDKRKAINFHEQALQMRQEIFNDTHPDIATSLHNLGSAWDGLGDYKKAIVYYEQALQMRRTIYGETAAHPDIAASLNNLGTAWDNLGDKRKAISYQEQALQMRKKIYGKSSTHPDIAASLNNLGSAWDDIGDHRKSIDYYQQALEVWQIMYGKSAIHPDISASLNNLGLVWGHLGDHEKAVSYHEQALQMRRDIYGESTPHHDIATSLNNLGAAWSRFDGVRKLNAIRYYEQALEVNQNIHGENPHPDIATCLNNLASLWQDLGDVKEAITYYEKSLQMKQKIFGKGSEHPSIAASLNNLGSAWGALGDKRKAIGYQEQALQMTRNIYGQNAARPDIASNLSFLGSAWEDLGELEKSISYREQALQTWQKILGENSVHPVLAISLNNLGWVWEGLDREKSVSYYRQALAMMKVIHHGDSNHPNITAIEENLQRLTAKRSNAQ